MSATVDLSRHADGFTAFLRSGTKIRDIRKGTRSEDQEGFWISDKVGPAIVWERNGRSYPPKAGQNDIVDVNLEPEMTDGINIKISCDTSEVVSATAALNELAAAADKAREAIDKLFGAVPTVTNISVIGDGAAGDSLAEFEAKLAKRARPARKQFSL